MVTLIGILYIGILVYLANMADITQQAVVVVKALLNGLVFFMTYLGVAIILAVFAPPPNPPAPDISVLVAFVPFWGVASLGTAWFVNNETIRQRFTDWLKRRTSGRFQPNLYVHQAALVIAAAVLVYYYSGFILIGGIAGYAKIIAETPPDALDIVLELLINALIALLGVGLFIRRTTPQTLERLGVRFPTRQDIVVGLGMGILLFIGMLGAQTLLTMLLSPEVLAEQGAAAQQIFEQYGSALPLWFLIVIAAGVGEELLYRGALQPIFGIVATTIFFTLMHLQYALTPAWLVIFAVGLGFAWIRRRYSTTAAILAHMLYNGLPFLLATFGLL